MLKTAFWLWKLSDFRDFPSQDFVAGLNPAWVSDMQLLYTLYAFQTNPDPIITLGEQLRAQQLLRKEARKAALDGN